MLSPRTERGNRYGLAVLGIVLLALGVFGLGQAQNVWFAGSAHDPLLTGSEVHDVHANSWVWIVAAIAAAIIVLGCVRWLLAQGRRANIGRFRLETDPIGGQTSIAARTLGRAIDEDLARHPHVTDAHTEITGRQVDPELRITIKAADPMALSGIRQYVGTEIVSHARMALDIEEIPLYLTLVIG